MKGNLPEGKDEIAIDRMYADNNDLKVGDLITVGNYEYKITGLVALPDYLALFSDNTDSMFDSIKFGVAIVTPEGFGRNNDAVIHYDYSWKYSKEPEDEKQEKNGQIISHLNSVKRPLLQSTFQSIPIRQLCSQEMIWVETRCL